MAAISRPGPMAAATTNPAIATATAPPCQAPKKTKTEKSPADAIAQTIAAWNRP